MEHTAGAKLTLAREPLFYPSLERAINGMRLADADKGLLARIVARPISAVIGVLGLELIRKEGMDVAQFMLRRGIVAGGADLGNYLENEVMEHVFKNTAIFASPAGVYISLWTAATGEANDSGTEATGGSYARESVVAAGWAAVADGLTDNVAAIDFGTATASWGTITHTAVGSAASGTENRYFHGDLTTPRAVGDGDSFNFPIGTYDVSIA